MTKLILLSLTPLLLLGCPAPASVESVDGLAGGAITSAVTVPDITVAGAIHTTALDADATKLKDLTVSGSTTLGDVTTGDISAQSIEATSVHVAALTCTQTTVSSIALPPLASDPATAVDNGGLLGNIIGVTADAGAAATGVGYSGANAACVQAFSSAHSSAHVCSELEVLRFARGTPDGIAAAAAQLPGLSNATFATMTQSMIGVNTAGTPIIADDCQGWLFGLSGAPDPEFTHARHFIVFSGTSIHAETTNDCSASAVRFVCCG